MKYNNEEKLDQEKIQELVKKFDEQYGETVLSPDGCNTSEEMQALLKHNEHAKLLRASRREEERINAPTLAEKFVRGVKKLFGLSKAKQTEHQQQQQQNSR